MLFNIYQWVLKSCYSKVVKIEINLLQVEMITGCVCLSPEAGVLKTIVCTEPEEVPTHKVGKALESEMENLLFFFLIYLDIGRLQST